MPRVGLFWKLVIATAALSVLVIVTLSVTLIGGYRARIQRDLDTRLRAVAFAARDLLQIDWEAEPSPEVQTRVRGFGEMTGVRVTLIRADGVVLADSARRNIDDVLTMEPHNGRLEIIEAARSGASQKTRPSLSDGVEFQYQAHRIDIDGKKVGFVRTAIPVSEFTSRIDEVRRDVWAVGASIAIAAVLATYLLASRLTHPLRSLTADTEALAAGDYSQRVSVAAGAGRDMQVLARTLNDLAEKLAERERELLETNQTQATVLEGMNECVIAVDANERLILANAAAERAFGFCTEESIGKTLLEAVRSHEIRQLAQKAIKRGKPARGEMTWSYQGRRSLDMLAAPLPGKPSPGAVVVLRDVSDLKRLESLRQEFVANVSHELKTPLSSIKAYTETLLSGAKDDAEHCEHFLGRIDEQADRLHQLILDMLHLARIESGQAALDVTDVSIHGTVARCFGDFVRRAESAGIELVNAVEDAEQCVRADEEGLRLILSNLIDNAIKYTLPGGRVRVSSRLDDELVVIEVADTGIGVAPKHLERLFERFFRVDKARSRELGGTGLGLSIVKRLTHAMGGRVSVRSKVDKGSVFSIGLPIAKVASTSLYRQV